MRIRSLTRTPWLIAAVLLMLLAVSCSDDGGGESGSATTVDPADCPGEPIKLISISTLSGGPTGGDTAERSKIGTDAALSTINGECTLGRPIDLTRCDDKFDVNGSLECGRQAASGDYLALMSSIGGFDDGAVAAGLPGIFLLGTSAFDLTDENAYSSISGVTVGLGGVSAAKAAGGKNMVLVLPDTPALQFVSTQVEQAGREMGIEVETLLIPVDTTDFAPIAAQVAERDADSVGLLPVAPVPMINALADEGITPDTYTMSIASLVMTPDVVDELGSALDGMLVVSPTFPPTDEDNEGIAELRADLEAIGHDPDDPEVDFNTVQSWSNLKRLEAALLAAGPDVVESLDSQSLVDAVVANPIDRPEAAPYDFRENQLPELPELASFRIFMRDVAILTVEDGKYVSLSDGFVDVLDPPSSLG